MCLVFFFFLKKTTLLSCNLHTKASPHFDARISGINSLDDVVLS